MLKYVDSPQPFSQEQPPLITTTVQEYDTSQLKSAVKAAFMGIGMMGVMHLYFGYTQPLLVQSIMPIKNALEGNVTKVHLLGYEPVGNLKRPWKTGGLFAGAADVTSRALYLIFRDLRQTRRRLKKPRNEPERRKQSRSCSYLYIIFSYLLHLILGCSLYYAPLYTLHLVSLNP